MGHIIGASWLDEV